MNVLGLIKERKNRILGTLIAVLGAVIAAAVWNRPFAALLCMVPGFVAIVCACILPVWKVEKLWVKELVLLINAGLGFVLLEAATGNLLQVKIQFIAYNILFIYVFEKLVEFLSGHFTFTRIFTLLVCLLIGIAEFFVYYFRGSPIVPWDLLVLETAATVFDAYVVTYPREVYIPVMLLILFAVFACTVKCEKTTALKDRIRNLLITALGGLVLGFAVFPRLETGMFYMYEKYVQQGFVASFVAHTVYLSNNPPDGYDEEYVVELLEEYPTISSQSKVQAQNVIVVMLESFADLRVINNEMVSDEYMPFWDSLTENTIKGTLYVPVFGAGTCDSEFEALTGLSTRYTGGYPYVTKVNYPTASIARTLQDEGFSTVAYHPFHRENWRRIWVYPLLGFERYLGLDSSYEVVRARWLMRDDCNFRNVITDYELNDTERYFMFNVTMQNHGGYSERFEDFEKTVDLSHLGSFSDTETWLSLMKMSDTAVSEIVSYYETVEEPTLICFFGDHMPKVESAYYELLFGKSLNSLTPEEQQLRYQTPVMFWANYDLPEENLGEISLNYLSPLLMEYAGYDMTAFQSFLMDLRKEYPVLTPNTVIDASGHVLTAQEEKESRMLKEYEMLCYYLLQGGTVEN